MTDQTLHLPALDLPLDARFARPVGTEPAPLVILVHGFKGFMDWGCWPWVAGQLNRAGYATLRFNFSHNGIGADPQAFTELKRFEANTNSREVAELGAALRAAATLPGVDPARITLLGHSLGGAIALLAAGAAPEAVAGVITWASIAGLDRLFGFADQAETWRRQGHMEVANARTGQIMRLGVGLLEDWEAHKAELDVLAALRRYTAARGPRVTAIHGGRDTSVPLEHGRRLAEAGARLVVVPEGDHTFGSTHPFQAEAPAPLREALAATLQAL